MQHFWCRGVKGAVVGEENPSIQIAAADTTRASQPMVKGKMGNFEANKVTFF